MRLRETVLIIKSLEYLSAQLCLQSSVESNLNENYAMVVTVETVDMTGNSPPVSNSVQTTVENELKEALEMISELEKEKSTLQSHVLQLENARSSGL